MYAELHSLKADKSQVPCRLSKARLVEAARCFAFGSRYSTGLFSATYQAEESPSGSRFAGIFGGPRLRFVDVSFPGGFRGEHRSQMEVNGASRDVVNHII